MSRSIVIEAKAAMAISIKKISELVRIEVKVARNEVKNISIASILISSSRGRLVN